jgi:hypothetical protein
MAFVTQGEAFYSFVFCHKIKKEKGDTNNPASLLLPSGPDRFYAG